MAYVKLFALSNKMDFAWQTARFSPGLRTIVLVRTTSVNEMLCIMSKYDTVSCLEVCWKRKRGTWKGIWAQNANHANAAGAYQRRKLHNIQPPQTFISKSIRVNIFRRPSNSSLCPVSLAKAPNGLPPCIAITAMEILMRWHTDNDPFSTMDATDSILRPRYNFIQYSYCLPCLQQSPSPIHTMKLSTPSIPPC